MTECFELYSIRSVGMNDDELQKIANFFIVVNRDNFSILKPIARLLWHCQDTEVQYPENRTPEVSILILVLFVVLEYVERHKSVSTTVLLLLLLRTR